MGNLSDAQLIVAKRDFASKIFKTMLRTHILELTPGEKFLIDLRRKADTALLLKEIAAKLVNDTMSAIISAKITHVKKNHNERKMVVMRALCWILSFSRRVRILSNIGDIFPALENVKYIHDIPR